MYNTKELYSFDILDRVIQDNATDHGIDLNNINNTMPKFYFLLGVIGDKFSINNYFKINDRYYDIVLVDYYINIFLRLCNKYNINPSVYMLSLFIGISNDTIYDWLYNKNNCSYDYIYDYVDNKGYMKDNDIYIKYYKTFSYLNFVKHLEQIVNQRKNMVDDKLANSSMLLGAVTLHNDQFIKSAQDSTKNIIALDALPNLGAIPQKIPSIVQNAVTVQAAETPITPD